MSAAAARTTLWHTTAAFDAAGIEAKRAALAELATAPLPGGATLVRYHDALLFLCAHPCDRDLRRRAEAELRRIARHVRALRGRHPAAWLGQGLPFADTLTRFSLDLLHWLLAEPGAQVSIASQGEPRLTLLAVLGPTLNPLERARAEACESDDEIWQALGVRATRRLGFLVAQLAALDASAAARDALFDALDVYVRIRARRADFSKAGNRLAMPYVFFQRDKLGRFDAMALMNQALPPARHLDGTARAAVAGVVRRALVLTSRETDPATYMDPGTLRVFDLERGVSVALYGMRAERQLPLESYIGYMLFKNGLPAAYGGAWVYGTRALFGINIFEPMRGGESAYLTAQLLRVYRQVFAVDLFEVESYQFGHGNPEGIATGAFWFYHRLGFRPLDAALARLAAREQAKVHARPGYRTSAATLRRLAGSNMALRFVARTPPSVVGCSDRIAAWLRRAPGGDRARASGAALAAFERRAPRQVRLALAGSERAGSPAARLEAALLAAALPVREPRRLALLHEMALAKPADPYRYQTVLRRFLSIASAKG